MNKPKILTAEKINKNAAPCYGLVITNYMGGKLGAWRIFHSDGEKIYLIADDTLLVDDIPTTPSGVKLQSDNVKQVSLGNVGTDQQYIENSKVVLKESLAKEWFSCVEQNIPMLDNVRAVTYILDTKVWEPFLDAACADYVIGSPTIDLFVESHNNLIDSINEKCDFSLQSSKLDLRVSSQGYLLKNIKQYNNLEKIIVFDPMMNLYGKISANNTNRYILLAAPVMDSWDFSEDFLYYVTNDAFVEKRNFRSFTELRPVVCLKENVKIEVVEEGGMRTGKILFEEEEQDE